MDRSEFERLAMDQLDAVYRLAYHLTHAGDKAEDLVQEVYVRALRPSTVDNFTATGGGMRAWLFAICHNVYFTQYTKDKKLPATTPDMEHAAANASLPAEVPTAWNRPGIDWEQVDDKLRLLIEDLRPEFREVLLMWSIEGFKYREIAAILGLPVGTVMSRLHRARAALAEQLAAPASRARSKSSFLSLLVLMSLILPTSFHP
jgi:RNA polymerase sigma-70 factor (ECF subfamily)